MRSRRGNHRRLYSLVGLALAGCVTGGGPKEATLSAQPGYASPSGRDFDPLDMDDGFNPELSRTRGVEMHWRDRVFRAAMTRGMSRVKNSSLASLLPIARADPGFHSGSVTVYRWRRRDIEEVVMASETAETWLIIPVLLRPDRVLELEQSDVPIEPKSEEAIEVDAILAATEFALQSFPSGRWRMFAFPEVNPDGDRDARDLMRVYMISSDPRVPDVDVLVADRSRRQPARPLSLRVHHAPAAWDQDVISIEEDYPTPLTVARVLEREVMAREFEVVGANGGRWRIHSETGMIEEIVGTPELDARDDEDAELGE